MPEFTTYIPPKYRDLYLDLLKKVPGAEVYQEDTTVTRDYEGEIEKTFNCFRDRVERIRTVSPDSVLEDRRREAYVRIMNEIWDQPRGRMDDYNDELVGEFREAFLTRFLDRANLSPKNVYGGNVRSAMGILEPEMIIASYGLETGSTLPDSAIGRSFGMSSSQARRAMDNYFQSVFKEASSATRRQNNPLKLIGINVRAIQRRNSFR